GAAGQLEGAPRLLADEPCDLRLALGFSERAEVVARDFEHEAWRDRLERLSSFGAERCAQRLVPAHDFVERPLKRSGVEPTREPHRHRDVVIRTSRLDLIEEPEALLRERSRGIAVAAHRT